MLHEYYTQRGENLKDDLWQAYPRPQLKRESYVNLNGLWDFAVGETENAPQTYDRQILVPFCPESLLSGIEEGSFTGNGCITAALSPCPQAFKRIKCCCILGRWTRLQKFM
ncbi:MAG: hypothetical protein IJA74_03630 [Oscillospiraceae bacterium]|nr:hypothetical protein [Oscillospiraceae bacterium]